MPVAEHSLLNKFCPKLALDRCKIIHDPEGVVRRVAEACQKDVDSGMTMEDWEYGVQKQILSGLLGKIKRYTDEPAGALQYAGQFIEKALQWWFYNINKTRSLPAYQSLPYIKEKDPDYYLLLQEFSTFEITAMQSAGQKIINYICNHEQKTSHI